VTTATLDDARTLLREKFGFDAFRPGQERAVQAVLDARDTLVILPTGGGKSLCYQVPALLLPGLTVVVSPLISLMKDQVDALEARGLPATFVNSTLTPAQVADRLARAHRGEVKLLYVAPERFDYPGAAERIAAAGVSLLAIDEAHCISEWGHDFRPSYRRVAQLRDRLQAKATVALTATATPEVRRDIARVLALRDPEIVLTGFDRVNLRWHVVRTKNDPEKDGTLVELLRSREGVAIVYASTRKTVERVAAVLNKARIASLPYHAGLDDAHRADVQDAFMSERVRVIVATNAFGMGIDKRNVRTVIHHAMPGSLEAYYQEAGRAGRDGATADCFLLHAFQDRFTHEFFIKGACPDRPVIEAVYAAAVRHAADDGTLALDAAGLAAAAKGKISDREAESAWRVLYAAGAAASSTGAMARVHVRLLATPARISAELGGEPSLELDFLRTLWRATKGGVADGAIVDLDAFPAGLGGAANLIRSLESLESRQFLVWRRVGEGLALTDPAAPLTRWPIDWDILERRRTNELSQLEAMQKYAYTDRCRRGFVLRYFGDPAASATCTQCDNCLHLGHAPVTSAPATAGRTTRASAPKARAAKTADDGAGELTDAQQEVLDRLRALRSTIAKRDGVPAYVVFADRSLREMARRVPRSAGALAGIHGVGPAKMEKYGEAFLEVLRGD
jgi:ATP-dependent DNA helicase RecQ